MGLFSKKASVSGTSAGLFVFGGVMQYVEVSRAKDGALKLQKCIDAPYDVGDSSGEPFAKQDRVESNLKALKRLVGGKWPKSVYAGIQSKDVLLRTVDLPTMEYADMKDSFRYDFDRFFPIPVEDAIYDIAPIDHPEPDVSNAVTHCLAVAVRQTSIENLMYAAQAVGLKLRGIEPAPVAMVRCLMGPFAPPGFNVYALAGAVSTIIIATFRDNGIVYRNTSQSFATGGQIDSVISNFTRDLQSTVNFASTQLRSFNADKIFISGYGAVYADALRASVAEVVTAPIEIVNPWVTWNIANPPGQQFGWEIPLGLALRSFAEMR